MKLCTLDDSILLAIFSFLDPSPDLFTLSETCKRFRGIINNQHAWIQVSKHHQNHQETTNLSPTTIQQSNNNLYHRTFSTLEAAITSSRPGDTIVIKEAHITISNIQIQWPLRLIGHTITDTGNDGTTVHNHNNMPVLQVEPGSRTGLSFAATGQVKNLIIKATLASCVEHLSGTLLIDDCNLWCDTRGLSHLVLPIITNVGVMTTRRDDGGTEDNTNNKRRRKVQKKKKKDELIVSQCEFEKTTEGSAVLILSKKGRLQGARAIHLSRKTCPILWFSVATTLDLEDKVVETGNGALDATVQHRKKPGMESLIRKTCPLYIDDDDDNDGTLVLEKRSGQWRHSIPTLPAQCYHLKSK